MHHMLNLHRKVTMFRISAATSPTCHSVCRFHRKRQILRKHIFQLSHYTICDSLSIIMLSESKLAFIKTAAVVVAARQKKHTSSHAILPTQCITSSLNGTDFRKFWTNQISPFTKFIYLIPSICSYTRIHITREFIKSMCFSCLTGWMRISTHLVWRRTISDDDDDLYARLLFIVFAQTWLCWCTALVEEADVFNEMS